MGEQGDKGPAAEEQYGEAARPSYESDFPGSFKQTDLLEPRTHFCLHQIPQ